MKTFGLHRKNNILIKRSAHFEEKTTIQNSLISKVHISICWMIFMSESTSMYVEWKWIEKKIGH